MKSFTTRRLRMLVLWLLMLLSCHLPPVNSLMEQICVNVGYENLREPTGGEEVAFYKKQPDGSYKLTTTKNDYCLAMFDLLPMPTTETESAPSIGGNKFGSARKGSATMAIHKESLDLKHVKDSVLPECGELYEETKAEIHTYAVKHNGQFLHGWLGFEIKWFDEIAWAFVQVSDERGTAIGEFVTAPKEQTCDNPAHATSAPPKPEQFLPCSATGLQEAKPSQSVVYTKKDIISSITTPDEADKFMESPMDPTQGLKIRLTWRLNEYYCNRHAKFRLVVYFARTQDLTLAAVPQPTTTMHRGDWLFPDWFGAADIVQKSDPPTNIECNPAVTETWLASLKKKGFWIQKLAPSAPENDIITSAYLEKEGPSFPGTLHKSCRTYLTRLTEYKEDVKKQPSYGGRCEKLDEKKFKPEFYKGTAHSKSSVDVVHQCLKNTHEHVEYPNNMTNYKVYISEKMKKRKELCDPKKAKCPTKEELLKFVDEVHEAYRYPAKNATGRYIWRSRAYHGMMFTISALFLIPVANFMARFFKETFLAEDILGMRIWYFVHGACTLMTVNLMVSGFLANLKVSRVWGRSWSKAGAVHRYMGWTWLALFILVGVLGPLRPVKPRPRLIIMVTHTALGYILYFWGLFTIITSTIVPGSPSATTCYKKIPNFDPFVSPSFTDMYNSKVTTAVTWWLGLDIFFHTLMNLMQRCADRSWQVTRQHYFPLLPVVRVHDRRSFKCFRYRTFILCIYVLILSIIAIVVCQRYYASEWLGCDCGPLTCTHASLKPDSVYPHVRCGRYASILEIRNKKAAEAAKQRKPRP